VALDKGLITYELFSMLVLMAIVTTMLATPLYNWLYGSRVVVPMAEETAEAA
jgi:hypothetical protein